MAVAGVVSPVEVAPTVLDSSTISGFALAADADVLGVSVQRIRDLAALLGWSGSDDGFRMQQKVREFTASTGLSALDHVLQGDAAWTPHIGKATRLITYCWSYTLDDLLAALSSCPSSDLVWLDLLSTAQNGDSTKPLSWWRQSFFRLVKRIGAVTMLLRSMHKLDPLSRAWCMYELFVCIEMKCIFEVLLPPAAWRAFLVDMRRDPLPFLLSLTSVRMAQCATSDPHDKERILQVIEEGGGVGKAERRIKERLREWLVTVAEESEEASRDAAEKAGFQHSLGVLSEQAGAAVQAQAWYERAWRGRQAALGGEHAETLRSMQGVGRAQGAAGSEGEARQTLTECAAQQASALGPAHPDTLATTRALAELHRSAGRGEEAAGLLEECVGRCRGAEGGLGAGEGAEAARALARVYEERKELGEAERVLRESLRHQRALAEGGRGGREGGGGTASMAQLAGVLEGAGRHAESEALWVEVLDAATEGEGEGAEATVGAMRGLAGALKRQGKLLSAAPLYEEALRRRRAAGGGDGEEVVADMGRLGALYHQLGRSAEAEAMLGAAAAEAASALGAAHPRTAQAQRALREAAAQHRREHQPRCPCTCQ